MKRFVAVGVALAAVLSLSGCGSGDPLASGGGKGGPVVVGSANFPESQLLMEIYAEALRTTGTEVRTKGRIGAREVYVRAVREGELAVIPEYTGNLLRYVDDKSTATKSGKVYAQLEKALPEQLRVLEYSPAQDRDVLTVTAETAETGLRSMNDLAQRCGQLVLGAPNEWKTRWAEEIKRVYGCDFSEIRNLESGSLRVQALNSGTVQVANLFSTSAAIARDNLVKLADPKQMFPAQNVLPLVHRGSLTKPQRDVLNKVSQALTTDKLTDLNEKMVVDKANPKDLAKTFVRNLGL